LFPWKLLFAGGVGRDNFEGISDACNCYFSSIISYNSDLGGMAAPECVLAPDFHEDASKTRKLYLGSPFVGNLLEKYDKY
jgi:hypothetical protein